MFVHNVYFWLKSGLDEDDLAAFEQGLKALCENPPAKPGSCWGVPGKENNAVVDGTFTYGLHVAFDDEAGAKAYGPGEIHQQFLAQHASKWERVLVYDSVTR